MRAKYSIRGTSELHGGRQRGSSTFFSHCFLRAHKTPAGQHHYLLEVLSLRERVYVGVRKELTDSHTCLRTLCP